MDYRPHCFALLYLQEINKWILYIYGKADKKQLLGR
jgi:hypothetical protein